MATNPDERLRVLREKAAMYKSESQVKRWNGWQFIMFSVLLLIVGPLVGFFGLILQTFGNVVCDIAGILMVIGSGITFVCTGIMFIAGIIRLGVGR